MTKDQGTVWAQLLLAHGRITDRIDRDLTAQCEMTLAEYEVLEHLATADGQTLRMNELADRVRLSPSGLTRRFDTLVRRGWVTREPCSDDRRGINAAATAKGMQKFRSATGVHGRGVQDYLIANLDAGELACLATALGRLAEANAGDRLTASSAPRAAAS